MTIDLGFGWLTLPGGRDVGIVDVPGHRDFVENMLAGVAGIDAVWMVVASDEGVMAQTREHLAIIDLLAIPGGILVLTKIDLASDPSGLEVAESELRAAVHGTTLQNAPIVRVSARTGTGLSELLTCTAAVLDKLPAKPNLSLPRLAIDRVFSMEGFGTVVTGTLTDGELSVGDAVQFLPSGLSGRVRGLQTHSRQLNRAVPGSRTAVNVAGIPAEAMKRGEVLTHTGQYAATRRVDARVRLLPDASISLSHNREAKLFIATSETMARARPLGMNELLPGAEGWIQFDLQDAVVCARGDRFILRLPSPAETIGGGTIVEPHPSSRHKRYDPAVLYTLQSLAVGTPMDILLETSVSLGPTAFRDLIEHSRLSAPEAAAALSQLLIDSRLIPLEPAQVSPASDALVASAAYLEGVRTQTERALAGFHNRFPLRRGMPREELRNQLQLDPRLFQAVVNHLETAGQLLSLGGVVALSGHGTRLTPSQQATVDSLLERFDASPGSPPSAKECIDALGAELFAAMRDQGTLVAVSAEIVFSRAAYENMVRTVIAELEQRGRITLADVRDLFGTSRRYAQALLEHLDRLGTTRRIGDVRVLESSAANPRSWQAGDQP